MTYLGCFTGDFRAQSGSWREGMDIGALGSLILIKAWLCNEEG